MAAAATTATLNAELLTQLTEKITKRDPIILIDDTYAGYADLDAVGGVASPQISVPTSIHVPVYKRVGQYNDSDSRITIISLLNQWHLYTKTIPQNAGAVDAGILSGFDDGQANGPQKDMAPHLLAVLFGGKQEAINAVTDMQTVATANGGLGGNAAATTQRYVALLQRITDLGNVVPANNPGTAPQAVYGGWGRILNKIADYAGMPTLNAAETYTGAAGQAPPTVQTGVAVPATVGPAELIRYAFGLLYKIKVVLGTDWPETHNQLSMGGRNSKNNKRNKYTHRKKQYSQRRYKK